MSARRRRGITVALLPAALAAGAGAGADRLSGTEPRQAPGAPNGPLPSTTTGGYRPRHEAWVDACTI